MPLATTARVPQSKACCFGGKQDLSLQDYMLQYNNRYNIIDCFHLLYISVRELRFLSII